jgi:arginine:pyruvate transaminase
VDDIASAITDKTRAIFLATPNNPTGAVYSRTLLEGIAALCCKHDLWLVSDEVYGDITYGHEHISPATLAGMDSRCVTISSLSKSHAMAGWRLGWAIVPLELAGHLGRLILCGTYGSPTFIQDAAMVALTENPDGLAEMKPTYEDRRLRVCGFLDTLPGLSCKPPQGGMFAMLDVRGSGMSAQEYATRLLDDQGVATLPTTPFGPSATGFLRINLGVEDALLDDAIQRIAAFNGTLNFFR